MDDKSKNDNKDMDKIATTLADKDSSPVHVNHSESKVEIERLKLNRECLPHLTLSLESDKSAGNKMHGEEHEVILESVIKLDEKNKLSKHVDMTHSSGEGASTLDFRPLYEKHEPNTHKVISPRLETVRARSPTCRSSSTGRNTSQMEAGRLCLHEKLARSHSGPKRALSLRITKDSSGVNHDNVPVPHPPVRETKSDILHHGKHAAIPDGYKLT